MGCMGVVATHGRRRGRLSEKAQDTVQTCQAGETRRIKETIDRDLYCSKRVQKGYEERKSIVTTTRSFGVLHDYFA